MTKAKQSKKSAEQLTHEVAEVLYAAAGVSLPRKYTSAIVAAAGQSTRMGKDVSKQLMTLCGMPVLAHTLLAYERARTIHEIIVVCRTEDIDATGLPAEGKNGKEFYHRIVIRTADKLQRTYVKLDLFGIIPIP